MLRTVTLKNPASLSLHEETDGKKRLQLIWEADRRIQKDAINPLLAQRLSYYMHWPEVTGLLPRNNSYNYGRFSDVWLER